MKRINESPADEFLAIGLPGATEFIVIGVVGVLVLGILLTTWAIKRRRPK